MNYFANEFDKIAKQLEALRLHAQKMGEGDTVQNALRDSLATLNEASVTIRNAKD